MIYTYTCDIHELRINVVGPFALMANQPTVQSSPSSNAFIRTSYSGKKLIHVCYTIHFVTSNEFLTLLLNLFIESPTPVALNTIDTVSHIRTTSNALPTSFNPLTPVNATRRQEPPVTDVSTGKFLKTKYS